VLTETYQRNMLEAQDLDNQVITLERQIREAEKHNAYYYSNSSCYYNNNNNY
jgi:hypothetical protein